MRRQIVIAIGCLVIAAPAAALDLPTRKAGLWDIKMEVRGPQPAGADHAAVRRRGERQADERQFRRRHAGELREARHAACRQHHRRRFGLQVRRRDHHLARVVTGSFDSAYTVDVTSTRQGGPPIPGAPAHGETHMKIAAK